MRPITVIALSSILIVAVVAGGCGDDTGDASDSGSDSSRTDSGADSGASDSGATDSAMVDAGGEDAGGTDSGTADAGTDAGPSACDDGVMNGDETDVDCGGACAECNNGQSCDEAGDCLSDRCVDETCSSPEGAHADIIRIADVPGRTPGGGWHDSYSVGSRCYCASTFDHDIGGIEVDTPVGTRTVRQVCDAIGDGPGLGDNPRYNDIQCGNGPANDAGDEDDCPGRVDIGREGCGHIGPLWDLSVVE